jgi:hypothetical protein
LSASRIAIAAGTAAARFDSNTLTFDSTRTFDEDA